MGSGTWVKEKPFSLSGVEITGRGLIFRRGQEESSAVGELSRSQTK